MTTSAQQQALDLIEENVTAWTNSLVTWLQEDVRYNEIKSTKRHLQESLPDTWEHTYYTTKLQEIENGTMIPYALFSVETGRKYHKIWEVIKDTPGRLGGESRSCHAFINKKTGEVFKPASYKAPAKIARFNLLLIESREACFNNCDWAGGYLYIR